MNGFSSPVIRNHPLVASSSNHTANGFRHFSFPSPLRAGRDSRVDSSIQERLNEFIRRKGLRRTGQRDIIVKAAFSKDEHFTADELFERARKLDSETSRATVYRTLGLLVEADLLREIDLGDNQTTYDPNFNNKPSHNHLVCIDCGRVVEFEDSHLDLLNDCVTRRLGFKPIRQSIKIEANCEQLRLKGRCPNLIATRLTGKRLRKKR
jgi:Fur family ferric uptake transcriptional regulator